MFFCWSQCNPEVEANISNNNSNARTVNGSLWWKAEDWWKRIGYGRFLRILNPSHFSNLSHIFKLYRPADVKFQTNRDICWFVQFFGNISFKPFFLVQTVLSNCLSKHSSNRSFKSSLKSFFEIVLWNHLWNYFFKSLFPIYLNFKFILSFQIHLGFPKNGCNIVYLFTGVVTLLCPFCEEVQSSAEELEKHSLARHGELNLDTEDGFENATQSSESGAEASGKTSPVKYFWFWKKRNVYSEFLIFTSKVNFGQLTKNGQLLFGGKFFVYMLKKKFISNSLSFYRFCWKWIQNLGSFWKKPGLLWERSNKSWKLASISGVTETFS